MSEALEDTATNVEPSSHVQPDLQLLGLHVFNETHDGVVGMNWL